MPLHATGPARPRHRRCRVGALLLASATLLGASALAACGSPSPDQAEFEAVLVRSGLSADESRCASEAIFDSLSDEEIEAIMVKGPAALPVDDPAKSNDTMDKVRAALTTCREEAAPTSSTTEPKPTTTIPGITTSTTAPAVSTTSSSFDPTTTATTTP